MKTVLRHILVTLILVVVVFLVLQTTLQSSIVIGRSMEPSFENNQRLLVNKIAYKIHEPERGDVIIFHPRQGLHTDYIKRIIALPGDTVEIKMGAVYVNGVRLEEPYIEDSPTYTFQEYKVPEDKYFVLGDNRNNSNDSHNGWLVLRENIIGKVCLSTWPPSEWGLVPGYPLEEQLAQP